MQNKVTSLEDFRPKASSFTVYSSGKTYELKELDAATECAIKDKYGKAIQELMEEGNQNAIYEVIFRLIKDKSDFKAEEIDEIDVDGNTKKLIIGGVEKFKRLLTGGLKESVQLANALTVAIYGKSADEIVEFANKQTGDHDLKKKKLKK